jgi:hemin uptake protein HemP
MDRETYDFRRSAAVAASTGDQLSGQESRLVEPRGLSALPLELRDRQHGRDRHTAQPMAGPSTRDAAAPHRGSIQTVTIQSILKGAREAIIDFDGAAYRLRITRNHRLILTK